MVIFYPLWSPLPTSYSYLLCSLLLVSGAWKGFFLHLAFALSFLCYRGKKKTPPNGPLFGGVWRGALSWIWPFLPSLLCIVKGRALFGDYERMFFVPLLFDLGCFQQKECEEIPGFFLLFQVIEINRSFLDSFEDHEPSTVGQFKQIALLKFHRFNLPLPTKLDLR